MTRARYAAALLPLLAGCALHEQVQYFEVVDPQSGGSNYYRMTIRGHGGWGTDYQMQAGYFSAAAVDVLRGQMPGVPEVDLPVEQDEAFDAIVAKYYAALVEASDAIPTPDRDADLDDAVLARARLVWFGRLSPADVAAMGMHGTTNPFQFRKLVFWTSAKNIDLQQFGTQIDGMIDSATQLIRARKAEVKQRKSRQSGLRRLLSDLIKNNESLAQYAGLVDVLFGSEEAKPVKKTEEAK